MNPPFSCRGGRCYTTEFNGASVRCSLALAFIFESLRFLAPGGQLIALVPAGCLNSRKDESAWSVLRNTHRIESFETNGRGAFENCHAETVIVRLTQRKRLLGANKRAIAATNGNPNGFKAIRLFRGKVPMYLANGAGSVDAVTLIHTTELAPEGINLLARKVENKWKTISGPAVLLPRVGQPSPDKVKLYLPKKTAALSDCVIALRCFTARDAQALQSFLIENWNVLKRKYGGTCAKYIRIETLCTFLESHGFKVTMDNTRNGKP
jgi:hypothetical protein